MKKRPFVILILLYFITVYGPAEKKADFPEIFKVDHFAIDDSQLYITQDFKIFIYSQSDYHLVKTFGERGDGPREFIGFVYVNPWQAHLVISSVGKVSLYSKNGEYLREIRAPSSKNGIFLPFEDGFVGYGYGAPKKDILYQTINLYDQLLKKTQEIYRYVNQFRTKKGQKVRTFNLMAKQRRTLQIEMDKILIDQPDGSIEVFDKDANLITSITRQYDKLKFTEEHRQAFIDSYLLANPAKSGSYNQWKNRLEFPTHFPPIQLFQTSNQKIYVLTHKRVNQKGEVFIYGLQGRLLKRAMVPIFDLSPKEPYPLVFFKGKLFQLFENPDNEEWELQITNIL